MRSDRAKRIAAAVLVWSACAATAHAAVEITQQVTMPDGKGGTVNETHKTTISGNRMKTVTPRATMITDLDKGVMVVLDEKQKVATEMPIQTQRNPMADALIGEFKPTGKKKTVAGFNCEEYTHDVTVAGAKVTAISCISKDAPGASEASAFYRKMAEKMSNKTVVDSMPQGIPVTEESKVNPNPAAMPNIPPEIAAKIAAAQAAVATRKMEVTSIKKVDASDKDFTVPESYTKHSFDPNAVGKMPPAKPPAAPPAGK